MKKSVVLAACLPLCLSGRFIFIPGSVVRGVSDAITGAEGSHCVGAQAKVGDVIRLPGGGQGRVKSLSGTSMSCTQPEYQIRALLIFEDSSTPTATDRR